MLGGGWRNRALVAEAETATLRAALDIAQQELNGIQLRLKERAALVSLTREGRKLRFIFTRNNELITVEAIGTWDDDVDAWKRQLLEPLK